MKSEYAFSKAVRGKFYFKGAELRLPTYLGGKVQEQLERLVDKSGTESRRAGAGESACKEASERLKDNSCD